MPDALRLAVGTLTVVRVPAPRQVTTRVAGAAMVLAPAVGVVLGLVAAAVLAVVDLVGGRRGPSPLVDLLGAALAVGALALLTRGLHLDGLADTADGLGVKGTDDGARARRLAVMRAPDVGAFGVVSVVLVLVLQVVALATCASAGVGTTAAVSAVAVGRLSITWCCTRTVPSARPDGLGAAVAGSVPWVAAGATTVVLLLGLAVLGWVESAGSTTATGSLVVAAIAGLVVGAVVLRRCVTRFGGITGDVLGAVVEATMAAVLVVAALGAGLG
jgi:adenosylcobinamide-GDP ribazoletransferase